MEEKRVVFVAGDGASGRILCEAEQRLRGEVATHVIVQKGGGAEELCKTESRPHTTILKEDPQRVIELLRDAFLVVVAHSGNAFQLEVDACKAVFARRTPCLKVFDHPLGTRHPHLRDVVNFWMDSDRPLFIVTAITDVHAKDMLALYPELTGLVRVIGNPLHIKLETLFAEGRDAVRSRLRKEHGLPCDTPVIAVFLSGTTREQFFETLGQADQAVTELARLRGGAVVNIHYVNKECQPAAEHVFANWREKEVPVVQGISQDEMIALCDVLIAAPDSTVSERALSYQIPVIQFGGVATTAGMEKLTGKLFPHYTPELEHGAVLWASDGKPWDVLLRDAFTKQQTRNAAANACGTVPQPGAMTRLLNQIREMLALAS